MNKPFHDVHQGATYQDVLDAPPNMVAELVAGKLHLQPRPAPRHSNAQGGLAAKIGGPFHFDGDGGPGGWWILIEPEVHLGDNVLVPDLGGWRRSRMPRLPDQAAIDLPPDWVCEVMSPSTRQFDRGEKARRYAEAGVPHLWMVDVDARLLEVFERREGSWLLRASLMDDDPVRQPPFDAAEFGLGALWAG